MNLKKIFLEEVSLYIIFKGNPNFYNIDFPRLVDFNKTSPIEEWYTTYMIKNTPAGAGM